MKKFIMTAVFMTTCAFSYGQEYDENYFKIAGIKTGVSEIREAELPLPLATPSDTKVAPVVAAGAIINAGAHAWNIINNGSAVGNLGHYYASAMPSSFTWSEVVNWKGPKKIVYSIQCENLCGMKILDMEYVVSYYYGGNYNGKGHYIANFTIKPRKLKIKWGFKFNMALQIANPMNVGTAEDPMAQLQADLGWDFSSPLKKYKEFSTYAVRGDGDFQDISEKSRELTEKITPLKQEDKKDGAVEWN
ncbi:MAG: hypothetical protein COT17_02420 [Elusimicrobia bacterium CG08_land_8_20_14_0_20_51_18]|nr:MAG: hypothetical protein COT17_02420 [Elusimicrobia bacterium CG08_land_8_20_14_0_20_51_18]